MKPRHLSLLLLAFLFLSGQACPPGGGDMLPVPDPVPGPEGPPGPPGSDASVTAGTGITVENGVVSLDTDFTDGTYWKLGGNAGTTEGTDVLGTTDAQALELHVNGVCAMRLEPTATCPNVVGGFDGNKVGDTVVAATIAGGGPADPEDPNTGNDVRDDYGTIGGGGGNIVGNDDDEDPTLQPYATVGGGERNIACQSHATIGGGRGNGALATSATVSGGEENMASGSGASVGGGRQNSAIGDQATVGGGEANVASAAYATIAGGGPFQSSTVGNTVEDDYGTIGGGALNRAGDTDSDPTNAPFATVAGGYRNSALAVYATVGGGFRNAATAFSTVSGGGYNAAPGDACVVGGGRSNSADGNDATISGGYRNKTAQNYSSVGGGRENEALAAASSVGGGFRNKIPTLATGATIAGGQYNFADAEYATIAGGGSDEADSGNRVIDDYGTVSGGRDNLAGDEADDPSAQSWYATVGGGSSNVAGGVESTVGGGGSNRARAIGATISGGLANEITREAEMGAIAGGVLNRVTAYGGAVPGGIENDANGLFSFAAGRRAKANHDGAFVWGDSTVAEVTSGGDNTFTVLASGGTQFYTSLDLTTGIELPAGSGAWSSLSDRNTKENFRAVDSREVLHRLDKLQVSTWNYRRQGDDIRHMGPVAQDFHAAFGLGHDERRISTVDADGVALAAIQGLYRMVKERDAQIAALQKRLLAVEQTVNSSAQAQAKK